MVKAKNLGYPDIATASRAQEHSNNNGISKISFSNSGSFDADMTRGSMKSGENHGEYTTHHQHDSGYMNGTGNREKIRCPKKRFSISESANGSDLPKKKNKVDNSDNNSTNSSLPEDAYEKIELFNKSIPSHVRLQILTQEVKRLKVLEKKKKVKMKKKQHQEDQKKRRQQLQKPLNLENNHRPKFEEAFCDSPYSSSTNEDDALMDDNHVIKNTEGTNSNNNTNKRDMGPYRRLSMLAAASLLDSENTKSPTTSNKSAEESSIKHEDEEDEDGKESEQEQDTKSVETNAFTYRSSPESNTRKRSRRDSTESADELDEIFNGMSRRSSMLSTASSTDGDPNANGKHSTSDRNSNPNIDNAIVSRRLSLIAAQAASLESRSLTRRASLIAAAEIFESLNRDTARRRSSIIGTFDKRMSFDRRNSLVAVSSLLSNIEKGNEARRTSSIYRRGSEISLGSVFSSLGGESTDVSPILPSRRASMEMFNSKAANVTSPVQEVAVANKSNVGSMSGNVPTVTIDRLANTIPKEKYGDRFPKGIDYESFKKLYVCMEQSKASQTAIHDWDRKMGLRRSHSQTMRNSSRSRKKLITVMTWSSKSS